MRVLLRLSRFALAIDAGIAADVPSVWRPMHLMMASLLLTGSRLPSGGYRRANGSTSASRSGRRAMPSMAAHDLFRIRCKDPATEVRGKITSSEFSDRERSKRAHFLSTGPVENLVDNPARHRAIKGKSLSGQ
jgi:hypothetical protein